MIIEAGLVSFLRTLFIFVAIYYVFKLIVRYAFPFIVKRFVRKQQEKFYSNNRQNTTESKFESKEKSHTEKIGDYVDYEEVDE